MSRILHWSDEEKLKLKLHYPSASKQEIISLFPNRSYSAVKYKAMELRIRKRNVDALPMEKTAIYSRKIETGTLTKQGNLTIHRMG